MQRRLEPDAVERVTRRRATRGDGLLHLRLNVLGDVVQEGQCVDHALHEGLCHLFNLSLGIACLHGSMPRLPRTLVTPVILASLQQAGTYLRAPSLRPGGRASARSGYTGRASLPGMPRGCPCRSRSGATAPGWTATRAAERPTATIHGNVATFWA